MESNNQEGSSLTQCTTTTIHILATCSLTIPSCLNLALDGGESGQPHTQGLVWTF